MAVQLRAIKPAATEPEHAPHEQTGAWLQRLFPEDRSTTGQRPVRSLTPRDREGIQILNHAMQHLLNGLPADRPETVFGDLQRTDMQAAAVLARVSRQFFVPPANEASAHLKLRAWFRSLATRLGLMHETQRGRVIPLR